MSLVLTYLHLVLAWAWAHPEYTIPLGTGLSSLVYTRLDKYPRWHAFFAALAGMGLDLPRIQAMVVKLVTGKSASGGSSAPPGPDTIPTLRPPPPPMPPVAKRVVLGLGWVTVVAAALWACGATIDGAANPVSVSEYEIKLQGCIKDAKADGGGGRPAALVCIQRLHSDHCAEGRDWSDAGVCDAGVIPMGDAQ